MLINGPRLRHLLPVYRNNLVRNGLLNVPLQQVRRILTRRKFNFLLNTGPNPRVGYNLSYENESSFVVWRVDELFQEEWTQPQWNPYFGPVRDQGLHFHCWAYAACDLVSSLRFILGIVDRFEPFCPFRLMHRANPRQARNIFEGHRCYGWDFWRGLMYIRRCGLPVMRNEDVVNCCLNGPARAPTPPITIDGVLQFGSLIAALNHLPNQPIGASLVTFQSLFLMNPDRDIYYGPTAGVGSLFRGYHAVIITAVERMENGEVVAVVRMSNGPALGYIKVSLSTRVMLVARDANSPLDFRPTYTPTCLLIDFACPIIHPPQLAASAQDPDCSGPGRQGRK